MLMFRSQLPVLDVIKFEVWVVGRIRGARELDRVGDVWFRVGTRSRSYVWLCQFNEVTNQDLMLLYFGQRLIWNSVMSNRNGKVLRTHACCENSQWLL